MRYQSSAAPHDVAVFARGAHIFAVPGRTGLAAGIAAGAAAVKSFPQRQTVARSASVGINSIANINANDIA
jgi:hypothetical protein